jgi:fucose 4-O-acetylase-like acetyltransferase
MEKEKDQSIETLRGLAILLVVSGHIIRQDINSLDQSQPSFIVSLFRCLEYTLATIRLPLFTVISGFLYAAAPATKETLKKLFKGKTRRILVPYLTFSTIQFILFCFVPSSGDHWSEFWKIYILPKHQLWFLLSVFNIFIVVGLLDAFTWLETPKRFFSVCVLAILLHCSFEMTGGLSIYGVNYLFPFFLLGYGIRRYASYFFSQRWALLLTSVFVVSFLFKPIFYTFIHTGLSFYGGRLLDVIVAFSGIPILFHFRRPIPWLAFFGYYAFGIHLFHRVSVTAVRLPFQAWNIQDPMLIFFSYLFGGVIIALLIQVFCEQFTWTSRLVLGLKNKPEKTLIATIFKPVNLPTPSSHPISPIIEPATEAVLVSNKE